MGLQVYVWSILGSKANEDILEYITPIVSYAALMWWPRIKKKVCVNELTKLQRTPGIVITKVSGLRPLQHWK